MARLRFSPDDILDMYPYGGQETMCDLCCRWYIGVVLPYYLRIVRGVPGLWRDAWCAWFGHLRLCLVPRVCEVHASVPFDVRVLLYDMMEWAADLECVDGLGCSGLGWVEPFALGCPRSPGPPGPLHDVGRQVWSTDLRPRLVRAWRALSTRTLWLSCV